jgi:hypothetical protein
MISLMQHFRRKPSAVAAQAPTPAPTSAWEPPLLLASVLGNRQHQRLAAAIADGSAPEAPRPLYRALLQGPNQVLGMLVSCEPHRSRLQQVGPGDHSAIMAGHLQVQGQMLWEIFEAFERDPHMSERIGTNFVRFVMDFERVCGVDAEVLIDAFRQACEYWRGPARVANLAAVIDLQSFDVLQTITDGRYTTEHWRNGGAALEAVQHSLLELRRKLLKQASEEMGLTGPVM